MSLSSDAFRWNTQSDLSVYKNLKVNLIFEKVDDTYVKIPVNCAYMFREHDSVDGLHKTMVDLSGIDTTQTTNMAYMFYNNYNLTSLDLSSFDTSNASLRL